MIYLIGGAPRCGKTTLAKSLSKKFQISWVASDTLEAVVMGYTSKNDFNKRFPKSLVRKETKNSNDIMYSKYTPRQIAKLYKRQSRAVWKTVEMFVEAELREDRSFILEGHHVHPKLVENLKNKFGAKYFKAIFLIKLDVEKIEKQSVKYTDKNDWFTRKTKDEETYKKIAQMISEFSEYFQKEAKKYKFRVFNMDNNFKSQMRKAKSFFLRS